MAAAGEVIIHYVPINEVEKGAVNGVATLDADGTIPITQIPASVRGPNYLGVWDADANTPTLANGGFINGVIGSNGDYFIVSVAGTTSLDGEANWEVGDWAIIRSDGTPANTAWEKIGGSSSGNVTRQEEDVLTPAYEGSASSAIPGDGVFRLNNAGGGVSNASNFYEWTTSAAAGTRTLTQIVDWYVPRNFTGWTAGAFPGINDWEVSAETTNATDANNSVVIGVYDTAGVLVSTGTTIGNSGSALDIGMNDGDVVTGTFTPGSRMYFELVYDVLGGIAGASAITRGIRINWVGNTGANP